MANIISIDANTIQQILARLDKLSEDIKAIKTKVFEEEPLYGSDEWWTWSDKKALKNIREGNYHEASSAEELKKIFKA